MFKKYYHKSAKKMNFITKVFILACLMLASVYLVQKFFNYWSFQSPVLIRFRLPIKRVYMYENSKMIEPLKPTPTVSPTPKKVIKSQGSPKNPPILKNSESMSTDQTIADYIRSKDWDYSVAIRLAKSENFWNFNKRFDCRRTNINKDGSIDRGIFQINSIHTDISPEDAFNCFKNINYAYNLYKRQGWYPWSAWLNGSYLAHNEIIY